MDATDLAAARAPAFQIAAEFGLDATLTAAFAEAEKEFLLDTEDMDGCPLHQRMAFCGRQDGLVQEALMVVRENLLSSGTILERDPNWITPRPAHEGDSLRRLLDDMIEGAREAKIVSLNALLDSFHTEWDEDEGGVMARL